MFYKGSPLANEFKNEEAHLTDEILLIQIFESEALLHKGKLLVGSVGSLGSHGSLGSYGSLGSFGSHGSLGSLKSLGSLGFHE